MTESETRFEIPSIKNLTVSILDFADIVTEVTTSEIDQNAATDVYGNFTNSSFEDVVNFVNEDTYEDILDVSSTYVNPLGNLSPPVYKVAIYKMNLTAIDEQLFLASFGLAVIGCVFMLVALVATFAAAVYVSHGKGRDKRKVRRSSACSVVVDPLSEKEVKEYKLPVFTGEDEVDRDDRPYTKWRSNLPKSSF